MRTTTFLLVLSLLALTSIAQTGSNWRCGQSKDRMSGDISKYCTVKAENSLHLSFPYQGTNVATLKVDEFGSVNVMIIIQKGQLNNYQEMAVEVKFDEGPDENFNCSVSIENNKVLSIKEVKRFLEKLSKAKKVMIKGDFYKDGGQVMTFNVSGFEISKFNMDLASNW